MAAGTGAGFAVVLRAAEPLDERLPLLPEDLLLLLLRADWLLPVFPVFFVPVAGAAATGRASAATRLVLRRKMRASAFIGSSVPGGCDASTFHTSRERFFVVSRGRK
jgi:hypothetical protein